MGGTNGMKKSNPFISPTFPTKLSFITLIKQYFLLKDRLNNIKIA